MSTAPCSKTRSFMESGTPNQFEWILAQYDQCLRLKAESKSQKPENIIKLDKWYQNDLPKKLKSRGKEMHLTHEELVQTIKWKLARGKFRPNLTNLVQMNTPRVAMQETKKAFRKLAKTDDVQGSIQALSNLKGVGPAMASAVLAAGAPHRAPFMADEVLLALPDTDGLDYTMKEYMRLVEHVNNTMERLNAQGGEFTPHKVEQAVWTYFIANDLKPEILSDMPAKAVAAAAAPAAEAASNGENDEEAKNGNGESAASSINGNNEDSNMSSVLDESSRSSMNNGASSQGEEEEKKEEEEEEEVAAAAPVAVAEEEKKEETTNGNSSNGNGNGNSSEAESKENGNGAAVVEDIPSKQQPAAVVDEDTSDSTKENNHATSSSSPSSLKRANEDATPAGESVAEEAASDAAASATGAATPTDEPAAKRLKPEEAAPEALTA